MAKAELPSPDMLRQLLSYDSETGKLTWLPRTPDHFKDGFRSAAHSAANWNAQHAGKPALTYISTHGYCRGPVKGKLLSAHRVVWAIYHGKWPDGDIDHINHDKTDNRIANLRDVPPVANARNMPLRRTNTSGCIGVTWSRARGKWRAQFFADGKYVCLGAYERKEDAIAARKKAEQEAGYHPNHGRAA